MKISRSSHNAFLQFHFSVRLYVVHHESLVKIHTLQLNFLFSDWFFSKYAECIENVHCTPRTAPRLREVLLVRDRERERHIH